MPVRLLFILAVLAAVNAAASDDDQLNVGVGIADCTGPPAEINFMGYANLQQSGAGLHLRQYSRAFIFSKGSTRFAYVSIDAGMMGIGVRREVIKKLQNQYGNIYNETNVILSGTHTHSAPGGFLLDFLFDLPILGFVRETFNAYVQGIFKSIVRAHENIVAAKLFYSESEILEANINRSPRSYLQNPAEERDLYDHNVDKKIVQLRITTFEDVSKILGVINWFAVHPTSMNNTNKLVSSDNVGYASVLMEKDLNPPGTRTGKGKIVCAFASTNLGDVSPNTRGPKCEFSGNDCDQQLLLCNGTNERCFASGPGKDMFDSTRIIATKLFVAGMEMLKNQGEEISGDIGIVHQYVNMTSEVVHPFDPITKTFNTSAKVSGCLPAMGYSFAAGTTDGPGAFDFTQGTTSANPLWNMVRDFIARPTDEDVKCQAPKPILLPTGRIKIPYEWQPSVVSCSIARVGPFILAAVPGEFTTMSGRRLRYQIAQVVRDYIDEEPKVVIAGLSNVYADYIATYEEYQEQRYEGASTIYGPHTLSIYLNKYVHLTNLLFKGEQPKRGPEPFNPQDDLITLVPPVLWDTAHWGYEFGDCTTQPARRYKRGDRAKGTFVAGHPRNNLRHGRSYLAVERLKSADDDEWETIATDSDWETRFIWTRSSKILGTSYVDVIWDIPEDTPTGIYRLRHYGTYKYVFGGLYSYEGFTNEFQVRCHHWLKLNKREDLLAKDLKTLRGTYHVCGAHFESAEILSKHLNV